MTADLYNWWAAADIDDLRFYSRTLSESEIHSFMEAFNLKNSSQLCCGELHLDENCPVVIGYQKLLNFSKTDSFKPKGHHQKFLQP